MVRSLANLSLTRLVAYALRIPSVVVNRKVQLGDPVPIKEPPRRVLIVKVHGMGDSVLVRALIELLRHTHPEVEIGVLVSPSTRELMTSGIPVRCHSYDQKQLSLSGFMMSRREIQQCSYDAIMNLEQASLAGTAFLASLGIQPHAGFVKGSEDPKYRLLSHQVTFRESDSMWESFLRLARTFYSNLANTPPAINLKASVDSEAWVEEWWQRQVGRKDQFAIALHLGCGPGMMSRRWPLSRFLRLADRINLRIGKLAIVLTGTSYEKELIAEFLKGFQGRAIDASNLGSIEKTALVLNRCRLLVSNDTGVMHLGAALGTPTIGLFGPSSPMHWAPLGRAATYVRETALSCSPCMNNYRNQLPVSCTNHTRDQCMTDISVESVESAINLLLNKAPQKLTF